MVMHVHEEERRKGDTCRNSARNKQYVDIFAASGVKPA